MARPHAWLRSFQELSFAPKGRVKLQASGAIQAHEQEKNLKGHLSQSLLLKFLFACCNKSRMDVCTRFSVFATFDFWRGFVCNIRRHLVQTLVTNLLHGRSEPLR